jgi:hypothetical protein
MDASAGNLIHDAHIAALRAENGVIELLTADQNLARFSQVRVRNPFRTWLAASADSRSEKNRQSVEIIRVVRKQLV